MKKNFLFIVCLILLIVSISSVSASADVNKSIDDVADESIDSYIDDEDVLGDSILPSIPNIDVPNINMSDIVDLNVSNVTKYYNGPEKIEVSYSVLNKPMQNTTINFYIDNKQYENITNAEGKTSLDINLNPGVYDIVARHLVIFKKSTLTIKPTIEGNDVIKTYRNATQFSAKFLDTAGKELKNVDVKFNINGVDYTRTTNDLGFASFNINLIDGEYTLTAINPVTTEEHSYSIKVLAPIMENKNLTKYFRNESQYSIRLLDNQGNPVGKGVTALFNIHGVFYNRTSDENGYVKLNINLNPGDYIITVIYNGYEVSNTIKVLPVLVGSDLTKQWTDLTPFSAKLVDGRGIPLIGKVITFNVNGVMYNRTTDIFGYARLNINLWPGQYIITSMYGENGAITSNKITITSIFG